MRRLWIPAVGLALGLAAPAVQASPEVTLGAGGEIYQARTGRYGELFPGAAPDQADNVALVLDVLRAGEPVERLLVPGTEGPEIESAPFVLYQGGLDTVFVVWQSRVSLIHTRVELIRLADSSWSERIPLSGDFWSQKSSPRIAVTTDTYRQADADGAMIEHRRTVVHTVWWEEAGGGERTIYAPVLLVDGEHIENSVTQVLDELDEGGAAAAARPRADLYQSPAVGDGRPNAVIASLVNPQTGRLLNLEIEVMPWQLTELAAQVETAVLAQATASPKDIRAIADQARAHILIAGANWFNRRFTNSLANDLHARIVELGEAGRKPASIAGGARAHILIAGAEIAGPRLVDASRRLALPLAQGEGHAPAIISLRVASQLPAPTTGEGETTILSAPDGGNTVVAWEAGGQIIYRESTQDGWSPEHALQTGPQLDRERAFQILARRVRSN